MKDNAMITEYFVTIEFPTQSDCWMFQKYYRKNKERLSDFKFEFSLKYASAKFDDLDAANYVYDQLTKQIGPYVRQIGGSILRP